MEVIAREWRVGEGPAGAIPADAGTAAQRELFAAVRENRFALAAAGAPAPAPRAAGRLRAWRRRSSTAWRSRRRSGGRSRPTEIYAPFVKDRVPAGVSPAAVLGPFRNFQAKLLSAWARAVLAGKPPRDIADLSTRTATRCPPSERRSSAIFVVTTFGATVKAGRRLPGRGQPGRALCRADGAGGRGRRRASVVARRARALIRRRAQAGSPGRAMVNSAACA